MFLPSKPDAARIREFLDRQRDLPFSYAGVGATQGEAPPGYTVDRNRICIGRGGEDFALAQQAIRSWKMFATSWTFISGPSSPIEPGATVALAVSHFAFWSLNACRIVYVVDDPQTYGFAYGTLPGHAASGEERFTVRIDPADGSVWYEIYAFSRPKLVAGLAYPVSRMLQKRFARDSKRAMLAAVSRPSSSPPAARR